LTPIQLSSQRLFPFSSIAAIPAENRSAPRRRTHQPGSGVFPRLIEREVSTLAALVNEFSQFVRFPTAKLATHERQYPWFTKPSKFFFRPPRWHNHQDFARPKTCRRFRADGGLPPAASLSNLIDNAAESPGDRKRFVKLWFSTCAHGDAENCRNLRPGTPAAEFLSRRTKIGFSCRIFSTKKSRHWSRSRHPPRAHRPPNMAALSMLKTIFPVGSRFPR